MHSIARRSREITLVLISVDHVEPVKDHHSFDQIGVHARVSSRLLVSRDLP
jgi:hypothetical protein